MLCVTRESHVESETDKKFHFCMQEEAALDQLRHKAQVKKQVLTLAIKME